MRLLNDIVVKGDPSKVSSSWRCKEQAQSSKKPRICLSEYGCLPLKILSNSSNVQAGSESLRKAHTQLQHWLSLLLRHSPDSSVGDKGHRLQSPGSLLAVHSSQQVHFLPLCIENIQFQPQAWDHTAGYLNPTFGGTLQSCNGSQFPLVYR